MRSEGKGTTQEPEQQRRRVKKRRPGWASRLDRRLRELKLSNMELGHRLGHETGSRVSHWRTGEHRPWVEELEPLCAELGVSVQWLVTGQSGPGTAEVAFLLWFEEFRRAFLAGADPAEFWERVLGRALTAAERAQLDADPEGLRAFLREHPRTAWELLDREEQGAVEQIVRLLARRTTRTRPGAPGTPA